MADLSRYDDWLAWLTQRAASDPDVLVAWVGGSAATGGWHISDLSDAHSHLDVRRHGTPVVLHDPDERIVLEEEDVGAATTAALDQARQRRSTDEWLVNRALARGHPAEAVDLPSHSPRSLRELSGECFAWIDELLA